MHEWEYDKTQAPRRMVNKLGEVSLDKPEPVNNLITWVYETGSFVPCAKIVGNETFSIINDYIGRPILAFNEKGEKVWQTDYDIYGDLRNLQGNREFIPFRQLGQYEDIKTGLYYSRFRYYDPNTGTYISKDPIGLAGGFALYAYVKDSNAWVDIFGLDWVYQIVDSSNSNNIKYYGITERNPIVRGNEHIVSGILKKGEKMQIIAENVNHDQARTIEAMKIRKQLDISNVDTTQSIAKQLEDAGLRNKNRGRDIGKRPFDPDKMGGDFSLLSKPKDVNGLKINNCN